MLNNHCCSARSYASKRIEVIELLLNAAKQGANLLDKKIDYQLLIVFQNYLIAVMDSLTQKTNYNFSTMYMRFNVNIANYEPKVQVQKTVEFLISIVEKL